MANRYESFYLADLEEMIRKMALDKMEKPYASISVRDNNDTYTSTGIFRSAAVAFRNDGIKIMAEAVIAELYRQSEENEMQREVQKKAEVPNE